MISTIIAFIIMLNPFALFLYLLPIMKKLSNKAFLNVIFKATVISFAIYLLFVLTGNFVFEKLFSINFEAFRIFGGIIIFSFAYLFIIKGNKAMIHMKGSLDEIAEEIALPFMVGAGTISLTLLMAHTFSISIATMLLMIILSLNYLVVALLKYIRDNIKKKKFRLVFDRNLEILLRLNGFFLGAIGINMIITGINNLYL